MSFFDGNDAPRTSPAPGTKILTVMEQRHEQRVELNEDVQAHLLWDALAEVAGSYKLLTDGLHAYLDKDGDIKTKEMNEMGRAVQSEGAKLVDAGRRIQMFCAGVNGGAFDGYVMGLDRTILGPQKGTGNSQKVYVSSLGDVTTFVVEPVSNMHVLVGINSDYKIDGSTLGVPCVHVNMENVGERYLGDKGEPILQVGLHDAELYDFNGADGTDQPTLGELVDRVPSYENLRHEPDNQDGEQYDWMVDVIMPWARDEDNLPRLEHGHGPTPNAALKMAQETAELFRKAGHVAPGDWPKKNDDN